MLPRVIYFPPHFLQPGGASTFAVETAKRLAQKGHDVDVISTHIPERVQSEYANPNLHWHELACPKTSTIWFWLGWPVWFWQVWQVVTQLEIKSQEKNQQLILFPQVFPANWWGFLYKKFHPKNKLLWMCQEPSAFIHSEEWRQSLPAWWARVGLKWLRPLWRIADVWLANSADLVLANSVYTRNLAVSTYHFSRDQILIAHPGADATAFQSTVTFRQPWVVCTARHTKFKKIHLLLEAWSELQAQRKLPGAQLHLIGTGEDTTELKQLATHLKIQPSVVWLGSVSATQLKTELSQAKVYVHPTQNEPFGIAVVEALASGTPAVVFAGGGPGEIVEDGKSGIVVQTPTAQALADGVRTMLVHPEWQNYSAAATQRAADFSWEKSAEQIEAGIKLLTN